MCDIFYYQYLSRTETVGSKTESITPSYKLAVTYQGRHARCADETLSTEDPGKHQLHPSTPNSFGGCTQDRAVGLWGDVRNIRTVSCQSILEGLTIYLSINISIKCYIG